MISAEYKNELLNKFIGSKSGKPYAMGYQLEEITKEMVKVIPDEVVKIYVPCDGRMDFNCYGKVKDINHDVVGTMPRPCDNNWVRLKQEDTTTLFWGDKHLTKFNFVPFYADTSCYRIDKIEGNTIYLEKDLSWRAFI